MKLKLAPSILLSLRLGFNVSSLFMKIPLSKLKSTLVEIVSSKYYSREEALRMVDVLLYGEMTGKSTMGLIKLMGSEPLHEVKPMYAPKIQKETKLSAIIDGGGVAGPLGAQIAVDRLLHIMQSSGGFGIVGLNNTFSSVCALSYFAKRIVAAGYIAIVCASSPKAIIYPGTKDPVFGTNPVAFGFPTETYPILFDAASSAITWYGLVKAKERGEELPLGLAMDSDGAMTTDAQQAMNGGILPAGGYKGAGFGLVVELLAGPLIGASYSHLEGDFGTTFIAIDPDLLGGRSEFKMHASSLVTIIKGLRPQSGQKIHVPGFDREEHIAMLGEDPIIDIDDLVYTKVTSLRKP